MLTLSYLVNILILGPLLISIAQRPERMDPFLGPATDGRRILVCLYMSLAIASVFGLIQLASGYSEAALSLGVSLFSLQILYKLMTVPAVGLQNPVVRTNLVVAIIHIATLLTLWITS